MYLLGEYFQIADIEGGSACQEATQLKSSKNELDVRNDKDYKNKVPCKVCNKYFHVWNLPRHQRAYPTFDFKCKFKGCNKIFKTKQSCRTHTNNSHGANLNLKCQECHKIFKSKHALYVHKYHHHSKVPKYVCKINGCGFKTMAKYLMKQHYKSKVKHEKFNIERSVLDSFLDELA